MGTNQAACTWDSQVYAGNHPKYWVQSSNLHTVHHPPAHTNSAGNACAEPCMNLSVHCSSCIHHVLYTCFPLLSPCMSVRYSLSLCIDFPPFVAQFIFCLQSCQDFSECFCANLLHFTSKPKIIQKHTDFLSFPDSFAIPWKPLPCPHQSHSAHSASYIILLPSIVYKLHFPKYIWHWQF